MLYMIYQHRGLKLQLVGTIYETIAFRTRCLRLMIQELDRILNVRFISVQMIILCWHLWICLSYECGSLKSIVWRDSMYNVSAGVLKYIQLHEDKTVSENNFQGDLIWFYFKVKILDSERCNEAIHFKIMFFFL